ncbi:hypothetical protein KCP73_15825 [Salmonella enterica subsp. enterica]|nr:hypothetical protein KCP73_15825 [Salmonella enterica subsp. enterica]
MALISAFSAMRDSDGSTIPAEGLHVHQHAAVISCHAFRQHLNARGAGACWLESCSVPGRGYDRCRYVSGHGVQPKR